jgi:hypothetical protein
MLCRKKACKRLREMGGPEIAAVVLAADRVVDCDPSDLRPIYWGSYTDGPDLIVLRCAVLALRAKRERASRVERVRYAPGG